MQAIAESSSHSVPPGDDHAIRSAIADLDQKIAAWTQAVHGMHDVLKANAESIEDASVSDFTCGEIGWSLEPGATDSAVNGNSPSSGRVAAVGPESVAERGGDHPLRITEAGSGKPAIGKPAIAKPALGKSGTGRPSLGKPDIGPASSSDVSAPRADLIDNDDSPLLKRLAKRNADESTPENEPGAPSIVGADHLSRVWGTDPEEESSSVEASLSAGADEAQREATDSAALQQESLQAAHAGSASQHDASEPSDAGKGAGSEIRDGRTDSVGGEADGEEAHEEEILHQQDMAEDGGDPANEEKTDDELMAALDPAIAGRVRMLRRFKPGATVRELIESVQSSENKASNSKPESQSWWRRK